MVLDRTLSRRRLLQAGAASAAAAALIPIGSSSILAAKPEEKGGRLIPAGKVGTITFTQRDVPNRLAIAAGSTTTAYLGGPTFPEDPTDLGPLVPMPGGWAEMFAFFNRVGIHQVEFAGYGQNALNPGGTASYPGDHNAAGRAAYLDYATRLRGLLDDAGLEAIGNHGFIPNTWFGPGSAGGTMSANDQLRFQTSSSSGRSSARRTWERATIRRAPTTGTSSPGRSPVRNGRRSTRSASTSSASTCTRTTTTRPTGSSRTVHW